MKVLFPDPERMSALDHPKLSYCPFIIDDDGSYPIEVNQYLRERALAEWVPNFENSSVVRLKAKVQTKKSAEALARRIVELLRWCDASKKHWRNLEYLSDLLLIWQPGLLTGNLSTSGRRLRNSTVNALLGEAVLFLTWAGIRGYRPSFKLHLNSVKVKKSNGNRTHSHKKSSVDTRLGSLSTPPPLPYLPSDAQLTQWLREVHTLRGAVKSLACETICRTGLRITECNELLVSDFPKKVNGFWPRETLESGKVRVLVHRGNKGPKVHAGSIESTNPRYAYFPIDLADRIAHYIDEGRSTLMMRAIRSIKDEAERNRRTKARRSERLWIGERSGLPFTSGMLYKSWTSVPSCPVEWHPHAGREFFAVDVVTQYMHDLVNSKHLSNLAGVNQLSWLDGLMSGQIRLILSPLLGHVTEATSQQYLKAGKQRLVETFGHPALLWDAVLNEPLKGSDSD